jgi:hypothetical protein
MKLGHVLGLRGRCGVCPVVVAVVLPALGFLRHPVVRMVKGGVGVLFVSVVMPVWGAPRCHGSAGLRSSASSCQLISSFETESLRQLALTSFETEGLGSLSLCVGCTVRSSSSFVELLSLSSNPCLRRRALVVLVELPSSSSGRRAPAFGVVDRRFRAAHRWDSRARISTPACRP